MNSRKPCVIGTSAAMVMAMLAGCNRAESPAQVNADVAAAQTHRKEAVMDARAEQDRVRADTAGDVTSADPDDRGDAIQKRADATYETSRAAARGDFMVARQGCEALQGDPQSACKQSAEAAYEVARANALIARDAERRRGDDEQRLNN